jgi:hypothetical protein
MSDNNCIITIDSSRISYDTKSWKITRTFELFDMFESINRNGTFVEKIQVIVSKTPGIYGRYGIPEKVLGPNGWCCAMFCDGAIGPSVFRKAYGSISECAEQCLYDCLHDITNHTTFGQAVLDKNVALPNALEIHDLSRYEGKPLEVNGYSIIIAKKVQDTQNTNR